MIFSSCQSLRSFSSSSDDVSREFKKDPGVNRFCLLEERAVVRPLRACIDCLDSIDPCVCACPLSRVFLSSFLSLFVESQIFSQVCLSAHQKTPIKKLSIISRKSRKKARLFMSFACLGKKGGGIERGLPVQMTVFDMLSR